VGAKGGCEMAVHAARFYLSFMSSDKAIVKIDFSNAFNNMRRDSKLEAVGEHILQLLPFVISAYASPSVLQFGNFTIASQERLQQGDPLRPLLFSVTFCSAPLLDSKVDSSTRAFFLLGNALAMLKFMLLLRSAPCFDCAKLPEFIWSSVAHSPKRKTVI